MRIGVDICNTIANVNPAIIGHLLKGDADLDVKQIIEHYYHPAITPVIFLENPHIFAKARPYKNAAAQLRDLASCHKLFYVTARPEMVRMITEQWLKQHSFPEAPLIMGRSKPDVVKKLAIDVMFEDAPHEIVNLRGKCRVLVRAQRYNVHLPEEKFTWKKGVAF
ncbi:MAG: hypothetical protein DDT34_02435 [Firmicutes bacterium]|nr:hypothetical protein [Bacillota bacterium]